MSEVTLQCPTCGARATAELRRSSMDATRVEVSRYSCPNGCTVDTETVRQIVGTSDG